MCIRDRLHWTHATGVVGFGARFPRGVRSAAHVSDWSLNATSAEGATYTAALVRLGGAAATQQLVTDALAGRGPAQVALRTQGNLRVTGQLSILLPARSVAPGRYVYVLRAVAELAPERASLAFSAPFTLR